MYCMSCGTKMLNGAAFCASCGTPAGAVAPAYAGAVGCQAASFGSVSSHAGQVCAASVGAVSSYAGPPSAESLRKAPAPSKAGATSVSAGCAGTAWRDMTASEGWAGTTALLGLLNVVPILNLFVSGYAMRWGADAVRADGSDAVSASRSRTGLPQRIFCERNFANGFYGLLENIVYGGVVALLAAALATVPVAGGVAGCIAAILGILFIALGGMRIALSGHLGPAFDVSRIGAMLARKPGRLFGACVLPWVLGGAVTAALMLLAAASTCVLAFSLAGMPVSALASAQAWMVVLSAPVPLVILTIAAMGVLFIGAWGAAVAEVLMFRALGVWVARYAPEWRQDPLLAAPEVTFDSREPDGYSIVPPPPGFHVGALGDVYDGSSPVRPYAGSSDSRSDGAVRIPSRPSVSRGRAEVSSSGQVGGRYEQLSRDAGECAPCRASFRAEGSLPFESGGVACADASSDARHVVRDAHPVSVASVPHSQLHSRSPRFTYANVPYSVVNAVDFDDGCETVVLESPDDEDLETFVYVAPKVPLTLTRANGERLDVASLPATLGKGSKADVMISGNPSISRLHARVRQSGDYYLIEDLNSTNKTYLNGTVVSPGKSYLLEDGAELKFGNETFGVKVR